MAFHGAKDSKPAYGRVLIMGEPGLGKTLLASSLEETLILDIEGRAAHAQRPRYTFTKDRSGLNELQNVLKALARLKPTDGALPFKVDGETLPVKVIQLDSLDELQLNIDLTLTSKGFDYWREMLSTIRGIITMGRMCSAHLVCVAHTKVYGSEEKDTVPEVNLALQGQANQQLPRWFDVILNMVYDPKRRQTVILTQPTMIGGKLYWAKDALNLFKGQQFALQFKDGRPDPATMKTILEATAGGIVSGIASDPDELMGKIEGELKDATSKPLPAAEFLAKCEQEGWDMGEGGEAKRLLVEKFGAGYNADRGMEYIEYLRQVCGGGNGQQG